MMKVTVVNLIRVFTITGCLSWYQCNADQQATKDDGVDFAKSLTGGVINDAKYTPPGTVPGFTTTALPETGYYGSQDLGGLQTDAQTMVTTGAGNDAAQFAYEQSTVPKLLFSDTDPLITNAGTVSTNAVINPDVLTVTTGDCAVTNVSSAETNIEHCTAWMIPTAHTCDNTLNVNVTWSDAANCAVGSGFGEIQQLAYQGLTQPDGSTGYFDPNNTTDFVFARAYCNPALPDNLVEVEVYAESVLSDGTHVGTCDGQGWLKVTHDTSGQFYFTNTYFKPLWLNTCVPVQASVSGSCTNGQCEIDVRFYDYWDTPFWELIGEIHLSFEKPAYTVQVPTVTETWNDTCGYLEAQVLP